MASHIFAEWRKKGKKINMALMIIGCYAADIICFLAAYDIFYNKSANSAFSLIKKIIFHIRVQFGYTFCQSKRTKTLEDFFQKSADENPYSGKKKEAPGRDEIKYTNLVAGWEYLFYVMVALIVIGIITSLAVVVVENIESTGIMSVLKIVGGIVGNSVAFLYLFRENQKMVTKIIDHYAIFLNRLQIAYKKTI